MKALHALILLLVLSSCQAKTLTVDGKGSSDALNLQDAILLAEDGDSITLLPGNYSGAKVDRSLNITGGAGVNLKGSLILDAPGCSISYIDIIGPGSGPGISLASSGCILSGCNISSPANAVYISGEGNRLESCSINSLIGVQILGAKNAVLRSNITAETAVSFNRTREGTVEGCRFSALRGVVLEECSDSSVANNSYSGEGMAIILSRSYSNLVLGNSLSGKMVSGIDAFQSWGNNFSHNNISGGQVGMSLRGSQSCNLTGNKCRRNERAGIFLEGGANNLLQDNRLWENGNGILLQGSAENVLANNSASKNMYGISIRACGKNQLQESRLWDNYYNLRIDSGQGIPKPSNYDFFDQDIDESNLVENKSVCYLVGKADLSYLPIAASWAWSPARISERQAWI